MEQTFFDYVEQWCTRYIPMAHHRDTNPRFFLTESFYGLMDFMVQIDAQTQGPCVVMETMTDGTIDKYQHAEYAIYFFVRADEQGDGRSAHAALESAKLHASRFINYLRSQKDKLGQSFPYYRMSTESVQLHPVGPLYNHWYGIYITLDDVQQYNQCSDQSLYLTD